MTFKGNKTNFRIYRYYAMCIVKFWVVIKKKEEVGTVKKQKVKCYIILKRVERLQKKYVYVNMWVLAGGAWQCHSPFAL